MNKKQLKIIDAFCAATKPPAKLSVSDWCNGRVAIYEGKAPYYDVGA